MYNSFRTRKRRFSNIPIQRSACIIITERLRSIFQILIFIIHTHFCGRVASAHNTHSNNNYYHYVRDRLDDSNIYARALGYPVLVENKGFIIIIVIISFFFFLIVHKLLNPRPRLGKGVRAHIRI